MICVDDIIESGSISYLLPSSLRIGVCGVKSGDGVWVFAGAGLDGATWRGFFDGDCGARVFIEGLRFFVPFSRIGAAILAFCVLSR